MVGFACSDRVVYKYYAKRIFLFRLSELD
jgi:hypothetical protein